jgi:hypothetical protein
MDNLLKMASKVEAAVQAYVSVQDFADREEWKNYFAEEFVSGHLHGVFIALHLI